MRKSVLDREARDEQTAGDIAVLLDAVVALEDRLARVEQGLERRHPQAEPLLPEDGPLHGVRRRSSAKGRPDLHKPVRKG